MSHSSKPIKFVHLQKLAEQSMLNDTHVIQIGKICTVVLMKAKNSLVFDEDRNVSIRKKDRRW